MVRLPPLADTFQDDAGHLVARAFGDTYFSRDDGLAESRLVFLAGNRLPQAWSGRPQFVIGELGFGSGLNILATWDLWNKTREPSAILHIVTFEGFLLGANQAREVHACWPELEGLSRKLISKWPTRAYGTQRLWFPEDRICITIVIGPCVETLKSMQFHADCWYLDGFAPSKNPDMWSQQTFEQVGRLSKANATVATYSVAGSVRALLTDIGFEVRRVDGFGSKRQRLEGARKGYDQEDQPQQPRSAIVIGGGIGGSAAAASFLRRGLRVDLFDGDPCGRYKASGNPVALIAPRLDKGDTREARFFRSAYLLACDFYHALPLDAFQPTGVIERAPTHQDQARLVNLAEDPPLPLEHLDEPADGKGLLHKKGGLAFPDHVLEHLQAGVSRHPVQIERLEKQGGQWCALSETGACLATADICVIAAGTGFQTLVDLGSDLRARAGQLSYMPWSGEAVTSPVCGSGYAAQSGQNLVFGATFEAWPLENQTPPPVTLDRHRHNQTILRDVAPELAAQIKLDETSGRGSIRVTTPDHLPLAGAAENAPTGLYVMAGLGSRGFTTAFMCAEIIAAMALGEPEPVEHDIVAALRPNRFIERATKRRAPNKS